MDILSLLAYLGTIAAASLAMAVPLQKRRSVAAWSFFIGMILLAADNAVSAKAYRQATVSGVQYWQMIWLGIKSFQPGIWLCFALTYSRGNYREFLQRSRILLIVAVILPVTVFLIYRHDLVALVPLGAGNTLVVQCTQAAKLLSGLLLVGAVLILMNLEKTFRASVGTMQWRVKFVVLGMGLIFGARVYTRSQTLIYSSETQTSAAIEAAALLLGSAFIAIGYLRGGFGEIDIYPSRAALHTSITVLLAGAYLFVVGVLAQLVGRIGLATSFQLQALVVLIAVAVLGVLLLSERFRQTIELFISRHFRRPQHDFRTIWSRFTKATGTLVDRPALSAAAAKLISETFNALSVSIWTADRRINELSLAGSTTDLSQETSCLPNENLCGETIIEALARESRPFDLEQAKGEWAEALRVMSRPQFRTGGDRICVPLTAADQVVGCIILADRVNGLPYTEEEFDLLKSIGDQFAASLLNLRLAEEVMLGKELQAFQTMSTFFVHDLKNAASTLTLMLRNLPEHFHDPAFREDALRGIGRTADRINQMISSLSVVREKLTLHPSEFDLNQLLEETLETLNDTPLELVRELQPLPKLSGDRQQLQSVLTNLLVNAQDAVAERGRVTVRTQRRDAWASVAVSDNGCGMSETFIRESLFRPFYTTKKKGLGIGMFQSKIIVEAHGGRIQVTSDVGKGTTFRIFLPLKQTAQ
ncbi:MAG: XrtA/PEP-CTERM system histidine kinase PrsK [Bryobacteraceae bacterium]